MNEQSDSSVSGTARVAIDLRRYPGIRRLAADYSAGAERLLEFYAGDPSRPDAWRDAIGRAQEHPRDRTALCDALTRQAQRRGAPPACGAAVERLRDPLAVAVITGQQAGLFGGPFYTLLKAITALQLAARIRREFGVPAEAVFWVESEDHDWNEVNGCEVLDADLQPHTVRLPNPDGAGTLPVARVVLDDRASAGIDELAAILPATEFTGTLLTKLRAAYRPGTGMSEAFGRWLEFVLGDQGLVVYDAADPATKPLVGRIFGREIAFAGRTAELAAAAGRRLEALGYHAQAAPPQGQVSLFHLGDGRHAIESSGGGFTVGGRHVELAALAAMAASAPETFSPNVLLRPIVQDALFPTVAYVAGPNELAYLGQLRDVYADFGVPMPLIYPRASVTLLDSAGARFLSKYAVPIEDLAPRDEAALNRLLEAQLPPGVDDAFRDADEAVRRSMDRLIAALPAVDPTLEGAARSVAGRLHHEVQGLRGKMLQAAKKRDETLRRQFTRTRSQAFPGGHAQERSTGFVYFLNRFGPGLVTRLMTDVPLDAGRHWILTV